MKKIYVFSEVSNPRLNYILGFLQQYNPVYTWHFTNSLLEYQKYNGISINYSRKKIKEQEVFIFNSSWLFKELHEFKDIPYRNSAQYFQLFPQLHNEEFDVFASIFYLLARIEEYQIKSRDIHGRFIASQSILYKNDALSIPIIDIWVKQLFQKLDQIFEDGLVITNCIPSWSLGIDIDQFYKYQYKSLIKRYGGLLKSLIRFNLGEFELRLNVLNGKQKDPYDTYELIRNLEIDKSQLIFFILSGGKSRYDNNHSLKNSIIFNLINNLKKFAIIGLHPSYSSNESFGQLVSEKKQIEQCTGSEITLSRNHYLKITIPHTYRNLIRAGIRKDFSLGYISDPGFRAGTCREFYWYDAENELETDLKICPLIVMDRCFLDHLQYKPEEVVNEIKRLYEICLSNGGHFHLNWHNSSFDFSEEWKNWEGILQTLISYFKEHTQKIS